MQEIIIKGKVSSYKYQPQCLRDKGSQGSIYAAVDVQNNQNVALKIQVINDQNAAQREMGILEVLKQKRQILKNIVQILDIFQFSNDEGEEQFCTIMELGDENFSNFWKKKKTQVDVIMKLQLSHQMIYGLNEIHQLGFCHRDIKPGNILCFLDNQNNVTLKICDIGSAKFDNTTKHTNDVGTRQYMAPEVLDKEYDRKVDIWSLGLILYEMFSLNPLFTIERTQTIIKYPNQQKIEEKINQIQTMNEIKNLMKGMIVIEPKNRLSSEQALEISSSISQQYPSGLYQTRNFIQQLGNITKIQSELSEYEFENNSGVIGRSEYGIVYKGQEIKSRKEVAIMISSDFDISQINILQQLKQNGPLQNVMVVLDVIEIDSKLIIITERAQGNLYECWGKITQDQNEKMLAAFQIVNGLLQIHNLGFIHRNLKPENILCFFDDQDWVTIKICDMGKVRTRINNIESQNYLAPEVNQQNYFYDQKEKVDVWAAGLIIYKILSSREMHCEFLQISLGTQKENQDWINDEIEKIKIDNRIKDLLKEMIQINPKNRIDGQRVFIRLREFLINYCDDLQNRISNSNKAQFIKLQAFINQVIKCQDGLTKTNPSLSADYYSKVKFLKEQGLIDEVIQCYDDYIKKDPKRWASYYFKILFLLEQGFINQAIQCYDDLIKIDLKNKLSQDLTVCQKHMDLLIEQLRKEMKKNETTNLFQIFESLNTRKVLFFLAQKIFRRDLNLLRKKCKLNQIIYKIIQWPKCIKKVVQI